MKSIIELAKEAGAMFDHMTWVERDLAPVFERFAALVRAEVEAEWIETNKALAKEIVELKKAKPVQQEPVAWRCWNMPDERWEITDDHSRLPAGSPLYAAPLGADHFLKAIAALREGIETCRAKALEEAAKVCESKEIPFDIELWHNSTKKEMTAHTAVALAAAIRRLK